MARDVNIKRQRSYPLPILIWNAFGYTSNSLGFSSKLEVSKLLKVAKQKTGLSDFGQEYFIEPLEMLVRSINEEAQLHSFGRFVTKTRLINSLSNRLMAEQYFKKHPDVLDKEILPTWWIVGLQRTGTTFLHRLIANSPQTRALYSWEALSPIPLKRDRDNKERIALARKSEKGLRYIAPEFFAIHPVEHLSPEEEILLLDISFLSTVPEATLHVPSYASWLESQDQRPAYEYMKKLLKLLQKDKNEKRWILKSPHHLEYLEEMTEVFPDTRLIFTHRDPVRTIASFCSMVYFSRRIFSSKIDKTELALHWKRKVSIMLKKAMQFREVNNGKVPHIDISYNKFLKNPLKQVKSIFENFGEELSESGQKEIRAAMKNNKKNRFGAHKYSLSEFNLNEEELEQEYSEYRTRYSQLI